MKLLRRNVLAGMAGLTMGAALPMPGERAQAQTQAQTQLPQTLTATTRVLDVKGKPAKVFGLLGPQGKPGLELAAGEPFLVRLDNQAGVKTIIHWHGQLPDWLQDGVPWPQTPPIAAGASKNYNFAPIAGTFWMHSHQGMQEQQLMAAPLIVQDAATARHDHQEVVMMLHDFSFKSPEALMAVLAAKGGMMSGMGGMMGGGMNMSGMNMGSMGSMGGGAGGNMGGMMSGADLNDVDYDAYLTNDRTLDDPQLVPVAAGQAVRLRVINGSSSTNYWVDLGGLTGQLVAVDGHGVQPVAGKRFPVAMAQRLDILLVVPGAGAYPVLAQVEGKTTRTGLVLATPGAVVKKLGDAPKPAAALDNRMEALLTALAPLPARAADVMIPLELGGDMSRYDWTLNGRTWPDADVLMIKAGQRVEIDMTNRSMMSHPMHLHGHAFEVVAINGQALRGAVRDTVLVPPMGSVRIAFDAQNPGRWLLHCHNLYHMMAGMMTELRYEGIAV